MLSIKFLMKICELAFGADVDDLKVEILRAVSSEDEFGQCDPDASAWLVQDNSGLAVIEFDKKEEVVVSVCMFVYCRGIQDYS